MAFFCLYLRHEKAILLFRGVIKLTAIYFEYITPEALALGRLKIPIEFDDDGEMKPLSMATLLFCDLHGRNEIDRVLNEQGEICFLINTIEWEHFFYKVAGMTRSQWEKYIREATAANYIDVQKRGDGFSCIRFYLEVYKPH
jgi:hypothetical protein